MRARWAHVLLLLTGSSLQALEPGSAGTGSTLWIVSGQSNASGRGELPGPRATADVRFFDPLKAEFVMAEDPLPGMNTKGVSAWVTAAQGVSKQGHRISMVGYALGARSIDHWRRGSEGERQLASRIASAGKGAGVFLWYQGESDTRSAEAAAAYRDRLADLVGRVRRAAANPGLTAVIVQLGAMTRPGPVESLGPFMPVREAQRQFVLRDGNALLLTALGRELKDGVHLATSGYVELGEELSRALLRSRFDQVEVDWPGPVLDAAVLGPGPRRITAHFAEVKKLSGVTASDFVAVDREGAVAALEATPRATTIELGFQREIALPARFFYAHGDAPQATLVDEAGNRAPAVQMDVTAGSPPLDEFSCAPNGAGRSGASGAAEDRWTEFRGPSGTGHSSATGLPREWSESKNVVWKTPIHGRGWSSPVVLGDQVWLSTATRAGHELSVLALDRDSGRVLHDILLFKVSKPEDTARFNSFASPTPVIEDDRVYVHFGSYGTAALDTRTGQTLWTRRDLPCNHWRGPGSSPMLHDGLLIVHFDGYDQQYAVALDKRTGHTVWKAVRPHDYGTDDGDMKKAYATPVVIEAGGRPLLISQAAKAVFALDPATGRELWRVRYASHSAATRPLWRHGLLYVGTGRGPSELLAIRPDGSGDVTDTHVAWRVARGVGSSPSPILVGDLIYTVADQGGVLTCLDARTGAEVYRQRLGAPAHTASPLLADGALYVFAEDGSAVLLAPGRAYRELGRAQLGEGGVMATPAIAGRSLFVRTESHLYRIEKRP